MAVETHGSRSSQPQFPVVEIGLRDIYEEVRRSAIATGELNGKLDAMAGVYALRFSSVDRELAMTSRDIGDHETRIRAIELRPVVTPRAMWAAIGSLTGLVSVAIGAIALFIK